MKGFFGFQVGFQLSDKVRCRQSHPDPSLVWNISGKLKVARLGSYEPYSAFARERPEKESMDAENDILKKTCNHARLGALTKIV